MGKEPKAEIVSNALTYMMRHVDEREAGHIVALAARDACHDPGGPDRFGVNIMQWVQVWRSRLAPPGGKPPHGPMYVAEAMRQLRCDVCGCRHTCNVDDPERPIAIGEVPVVGPVRWRQDHGDADYDGTIRCWVCARDRLTGDTA